MTDAPFTACNAHPHLGGCQLALGHAGDHLITIDAQMRAHHEFMMRTEAAAEQLAERVDTCHERRACPRCGQPAGSQCRRAGANALSSPPLRHPHQQRMRADGIPDR